MKNIKIAALLGTLIILFVACGEDSTKYEATEEVPMVINETLEIHSGDEILPESDDVEIIVDHKFGNPTKTVTLISGSAILIRGLSN